MIETVVLNQYSQRSPESFEWLGHAQVPASDRAFQYGDGCFTTMYAKHGSIAFFNEHIQRLCRDAARLGIDLHHTALSESVYSAVQQYVPKPYWTDHDEKNGLVIKVLVSRGQGGRGYDPGLLSSPVIYVSFYKSPLYNESFICEQSPLTLGVANIRLASQPMTAGLKHLNRIEQVLCKIELQKQELIDDLFLSDNKGLLIEASSANVYCFIDGSCHTPKLNECGVDGVQRQAILQYMEAENIPSAISELSINKVFERAEAMFLCNAVRCIQTVKTVYLDDKRFDFATQNVTRLISGFMKFAKAYEVSIQ